jgi:homoserine O-acetyltransferase
MTRLLLLAVLAASPAAAQDLEFAHLENCALENGKTIQDCSVGYRTYGTLNTAKSNAVLFTTWVWGTTEQLGGFLGPNGIVDTTEYYVIAVDALGNGVSSSPSNSSAQPGEAFPEISIRDMVRAQYRLLTEHLGVTHLHGVIGISMGGMQVFEWVVSYPRFMRKAIPIVGSPRLGSYSLTFWSTALSVIEGFRGNDAEAAQVMAILGYLALQTPQYRDRQTPREEFQEFVQSVAAEAVATYHPYDRAAHVRAMIEHDVAAPFEGSLELAAIGVEADLLVIVAEQDHSVTPGPALEFAELVGAETIVLVSDCGHLAFSCELDRVRNEVRRFLEQ